MKSYLVYLFNGSRHVVEADGYIFGQSGGKVVFANKNDGEDVAVYDRDSVIAVIIQESLKEERRL
ncbi:MAG: hypothetical protein KAJ19_22920 [Gammaproteobacteria bacterium]|nr:hypothetical protein [Gammaproteobacteria bacterium]